MDNTQTPVVTAAKAIQSIQTFKKWKLRCRGSTGEDDDRNSFIVFGRMGIVLLNLGIVIADAIPAARDEVQWCFRVRSEGMSKIFDNEIDEHLQYAASIGFFFSAVCWPVDIFSGFGTALLSNMDWKERVSLGHSRNRVWNCMSPLKQATYRTRLFTTVPRDVDQLRSHAQGYDQKGVYKVKRLINKMRDEIGSHGYPQLKSGSLTVSDISVPFARYSSKSCFRNILNESWEDIWPIIKAGQDPGELLYTYTIEKRLDLAPGEIIVPVDRMDFILLSWLEGLEGMTFRLMGDHMFDDKYRHFKYKYRWVREPHVESINVVAIRDEEFWKGKKEAMKHLQVIQSGQDWRAHTPDDLEEKLKIPI
jgi:hypothetical protein